MRTEKYIVLYFSLLTLAPPAVAQLVNCPEPETAIQIATQPPETLPETIKSSLASSLKDRLDDQRKDKGLSWLAPHPVLSRVAATHAEDVAGNDYTADISADGMSLLEQVLLEDRQSLYSTFGVNIAAAQEGVGADRLHEALMHSSPDTDNINRSEFTHVGIGTAERDGRVYIVQLFAKIDGHLQQPLPLDVVQVSSLRTTLVQRSMVPVTWTITAPDGAPLLRGSGDRLRSVRGEPVEGFLNLDVAMGQDTYTLRGPFIRMN